MTHGGRTGQKLGAESAKVTALSSPHAGLPRRDLMRTTQACR